MYKPDVYRKLKDDFEALEDFAELGVDPVSIVDTLEQIADTARVYLRNDPDIKYLDQLREALEERYSANQYSFLDPSDQFEVIYTARQWTHKVEDVIFDLTMASKRSMKRPSNRPFWKKLNKSNKFQN